MALKKGIYIPSIFTAVNIACGFYSILASSRGDLSAAAWAIIVAVGIDMLDGKIARWTKTESHFGVEFDSLADLVSFGVAPAFMVYQMQLYHHKLGWLACFVYLLVVAIRLARFNVITLEASDRKNYYEGLPSPASATFLSMLVLISYLTSNGPGEKVMPIISIGVPFLVKSLPVVMLLLALLLILPNIRYPNFSRFLFTGRVPMRIFIIVILIGVLIWAYPETILFVIVIGYILSGLFDIAWRFYRLRKR